MRRPIAALALALMLPLAGSAQEPEHPEGEHRGGMEHGQMRRGAMEHGAMQRGMMGGMGMAMMREHPGPGMILRLEESLGLSESQVEKLTRMHAEARAAMQGHMEEARAARARAHELMASESPDIDAFREALRGAAMHTVEAQTLRARMHLDAADVLDDTQRETLRSITSAMEEMHGEGPEGSGGHPQGQGMHRGHEAGH